VSPNAGVRWVDAGLCRALLTQMSRFADVPEKDLENWTGREECVRGGAVRQHAHAYRGETSRKPVMRPWASRPSLARGGVDASSRGSPRASRRLTPRRWRRPRVGGVRRIQGQRLRGHCSPAARSRRTGTVNRALARHVRPGIVGLGGSAQREDSYAQTTPPVLTP
jgi:hypothetical protein